MKSLISTLIIILNMNGNISDSGYENIFNTLSYEISDAELLEELDQEYREQILVSNIDTIGAKDLYNNLIDNNIGYIIPFNNYEELRIQILYY